MPVKARGNSYQATVNYRGTRYRRQFPTPQEASDWETEVLQSLTTEQRPQKPHRQRPVGLAAKGEFQPKTIGPLAEYLIKHKWRHMKGGKAATINLRHVVRLLGSKISLGLVKSHAINLLVEELRNAGYPSTTLNKKLSPLRQCLKYAEREGWIERLPHIPFFKPDEGRIRFFTDAEECAMLTWCRRHLQNTLADYIVVSLDTGLRQGEVLGLKIANLHEGKVTVWGATTDEHPGTKAGRTRMVPLTPRAKQVLERLALDNPGSLFPLTKDQITVMWARMRDALGHKHEGQYVPHTMRHTFCSRLVEQNVNLAVVQKLAGHARIETTLKYVHVRDDALDQAIATLTPRGGPPPSGLLH